MKTCPSCGYEDTPTERQLLRQCKKAFGDLPVRHMIKRQWIKFGTFTEVRAELVRFFNVRDAQELEEVLDGRRPIIQGIVCDTEGR